MHLGALLSYRYASFFPRDCEWVCSGPPACMTIGDDGDLGRPPVRAVDSCSFLVLRIWLLLCSAAGCSSRQTLSSARFSLYTSLYRPVVGITHTCELRVVSCKLWTRRRSTTTQRTITIHFTCPPSHGRICTQHLDGLLGRGPESRCDGRPVCFDSGGGGDDVDTSGWLSVRRWGSPRPRRSPWHGGPTNRRHRGKSTLTLLQRGKYSENNDVNSWNLLLPSCFSPTPAAECPGPYAPIECHIHSNSILLRAIQAKCSFNIPHFQTPYSSRSRRAPLVPRRRKLQVKIKSSSDVSKTVRKWRFLWSQLPSKLG